MAAPRRLENTEQSIAHDVAVNHANAGAAIHSELTKLRLSEPNNAQFQKDVQYLSSDLHSNPAYASLPPFSITADTDGSVVVMPENGSGTATSNSFEQAAFAPDSIPTRSEPPSMSSDTNGIDRRRFYIAQPNGYSCGPTSLTEALFDFQASGGSSGFSFDSSSFADPSKREAARAFIERASGEPASNIGNIHNVTSLAQQFGLSAVDHFGETSLAALDTVLAQGHGAVVNVAHHFVYISGKSPDGNYVVGDPADSHTGTWSASRMQSEMAHTDGTPTGFAEVWNPNKPVHSQFVSTANPDGTAAANLSGGSYGGDGPSQGHGGSSGGGAENAGYSSSSSGVGDGSGGGGDGGDGGDAAGGGSGVSNGSPEESMGSSNEQSTIQAAAFSGGASDSDNTDIGSDPSEFQDSWGSYPDDQEGESAVMNAFSQLGVPYNPGGDSPENGFDCSGLIMWAWARLGIIIPHNTDAQYNSPNIQHIKILGANGKPDFSKMKPGDILWYKGSTGISHEAMFAGMSKQGKPLMIEAPQSGQNVKVVPLRTEGLMMEVGRPHK